MSTQRTAGDTVQGGLGDVNVPLQTILYPPKAVRLCCTGG